MSFCHKMSLVSLQHFQIAESSAGEIENFDQYENQSLNFFNRFPDHFFILTYLFGQCD